MMQAGLKMDKMCTYFHVQDLFGCSTIVIQKKYFLLSNLSTSKCGHVALLFTNEELKKGWLVTHLLLSRTCWSCSWCLWYRLLATKWQHSRPCFCNFQTSIFNKEIWNRVDCKRSEKRSKTHKRLKEHFLHGWNRTKRANFRGSPLFQATYNIKTNN